MLHLLQSCWLSGLLLIASASAHAYPPAGLKPRYLATGTGISLPTASTNGTSVPTGSTYPTSTSTPTPTSFYLVAADTGNSRLDGEYVYLQSDTSGNGLLVLYLASAVSGVASFSTFALNADGTLTNDFTGDAIATIFAGSTYGTLMFEPAAIADANGDPKSFCKIVAGALTCQTGTDVVFSVCPYQVISGTLVGGTIDVGPTTEPGCSPLTLLVVPA